MTWSSIIMVSLAWMSSLMISYQLGQLTGARLLARQITTEVRIPTGKLGKRRLPPDLEKDLREALAYLEGEAAERKKQEARDD